MPFTILQWNQAKRFSLRLHELKSQRFLIPIARHRLPACVRVCVCVKDVRRALVHIKTHLLSAVRFYALKYTFADYIVLNSKSTTLHNVYLQYINFKTWIIQRNHSATAEHTSMLACCRANPMPGAHLIKYYAKWLCGFNRTHQNNYNFPVVRNMCPVCACAPSGFAQLHCGVRESVWVSFVLRKQFWPIVTIVTFRSHRTITNLWDGKTRNAERALWIVETLV